jgi:Mg-chelatase subunit ChlI
MVAAEAAPLIWINGFPGTGKFTVARAIASLHKLIDPVAAWLPRSHPDYDRERQKQRQLAFDEYASNPDRLADLLIFTGEKIFPAIPDFSRWMTCNLI